MSRNSQIQIGRMGKAVRGRLPCHGHTNRVPNAFQLIHRRHNQRSHRNLRSLLAFPRAPLIMRETNGRMRSRIAADVRHSKT